MFFAVLNEMMAAAASSKGKVRVICRVASPETELVVAAIDCPRSQPGISQPSNLHFTLSGWCLEKLMFAFAAVGRQRAKV
jgi:hypothetical protein